MKKSFFFAAVAAMFMVSCAPKELDSEAGKLSQTNKGKTVIGVEIVECKTVLGTPDANVYPINWQEGDVICVNSYNSKALTASDFSGKTATFTVEQELTSPFWAVYPASAAVAFETEGALVDVPTAQQYTAGSFDPEAAIMLGTGTEGISFVNAMSYIKVKTTGTDKISRVVVSTLGTEAVSGEFMTSDFATLVPATGGNTLNSAVVIAETPVAAGTDIIVAIPAQNYASGFMITIQSPEGKVYQKKSEKAFNAVAGHMYAVTLEYAPVAVEGTVTVDGDFADWQKVSCVTYSLPARGALFNNIVKMSLTADDDYVYGLIMMDETYPNYATWFDMFVDADGDVATGGKLTNIEGYEGVPYTDSGLEWYIEGGVYNGAGLYVDWLTKYKWIGVDGAGIFTGLSATTIPEGGFALIGSSNGNGVGMFEFKLSREEFGILGEKAAFGCKNLVGGAAAGLLPQSSDFVNNRLPMAAITMKESSHKPQPAPVEPITIDGDFSDWEAAEDVQTYTLPGGALLPNAHSLSFVATDDYVYVKFDAKDNKDGAGVVLDFFIDSDADTSTGMCMNELGSVGVSGNMFLSGGVDWYMQSSLYSGANYYNLVKPGYFLHCVGGFGNPYGGGAVCENHGSDCDANKSFAAISGTEDGNLHMEWRLSREYFGMTGHTARFGLRYGCPGWTVSGAMPQGPAEDGVYTKADLFTVNLPSDEPVPAKEPIEIDGQFEDWDEVENLATYEVPADALYPYIYSVDATASPKYLYVRMNAMYSTVSNPFYFLINADGNVATGFNYWQGSAKLSRGMEWELQVGLKEGSMGHLKSYLWTGADNVSFVRSECEDKSESTSGAESNGVVVYSGNDMILEWKIDRKFFGITGTKAGIAMRLYHGGSTCAGFCPQKSKDGDGKFVIDDFTFDIPAFSE